MSTPPPVVNDMSLRAFFRVFSREKTSDNGCEIPIMDFTDLGLLVSDWKTFRTKIGADPHMEQEFPGVEGCIAM